MEICRLCFDSNCATFAPLNLDSDSLHREQLRIVFPEIDLEAVSVPYICSKCSAALESAYLSKSIWMVCEEKLKKYMETNPDMSSYFLSDVVNDSELPNCEIQVKDEYSEIEVKLEVETYPSPPDPLHFSMDFEEILVKHETEEVDQTEESLILKEETINDLPSKNQEAWEKATATLFPEKSRDQHEWTYTLFKKWCGENEIDVFSENVLLAYFQKLSSNMKSSSLWSIYSMLRSTLNLKNNVDIGEYKRLFLFLKQTSDEYKPKKSKTLTSEQIQTFLTSAPDEQYLFEKVGLIFGVMGACRREELMKIEIKDIEDVDTALIVHIPDAKTKTERQFIIRGYFYGICKKYMALRPDSISRLFLNYQHGKCTKQVTGINKFGSLAQKVAQYLGLPDPDTYTGHFLRRSLAASLERSLNDSNNQIPRTDDILESLENTDDENDAFTCEIDMKVARANFIVNDKHISLGNNIESTSNIGNVGGGNVFQEVIRKPVEPCVKLIPSKSGERYQKQFSHFCEWKMENDVTKITEEVMLAYFLDLSNKIGASSLWPKFSMMKSTLIANENIDISCFSKLVAFLKKQSTGCEIKQFKTLTREELYRFMIEACTDKYLLTKVVAMIGIAGGCKRDDLYNISLDDIQETQTQLVVTIPCTKTNQRRTFTVINEVDGINCLELFRKYVSLRPKNVNHRMLFLRYRNKMCTVQRVGIHTIGGVPKQIALFLGLQEPHKYTSHSFRRTSATLLTNAGADLAVLKRHSGWKSSSTGEKYVEDSSGNKNKRVCNRTGNY